MQTPDQDRDRRPAARQVSSPSLAPRVHPKKRNKHTGRTNTAPFLRIEHRISDSEEFGRLSGNAVKLLIELARQYRPGKNGDLSIAWSMLSERGWRSKATVQASKVELLSAGWIIETRKGGKNKCSLFALTYYEIDESDKHQEPATTTAPNLWRQKRNG